MTFRDVVIDTLDTALRRIDTQVLAIVPPELQSRRLPQSNSIAWTLFHTARHAELALRVAGRPTEAEQSVPGLDERAFRGGAGLQEVQREWFAEADPAAVSGFHAAVFGDVRRFLLELGEDELARIPDPAAIAEAGVDPVEFGWLHQQWGGQPLGFLVQWPLTGHLVHHVGEAITYRNQLGLSPFR